jgi:general L-amino acid transport system permease protein
MVLHQPAAPGAEPIGPPIIAVGWLGWIRQTFFNTPMNTAITLACLLFLWRVLPPFYDWAVATALWQGDAKACRQPGMGACWAFVIEKLRFMLFGFYPADQHWRPIAMIAIFIAMIAASGYQRFWRRELFYAWGIGLVLMYIVMAGGAFGLSRIETRQWGGLPLTMALAIIGLVAAFPIGIALALGRRSRMPIIRLMCIVYIECIRGVPLITILFMSAIMFPLLLPEGMQIDKLLRAQVALILFAAAYIAEIVRGGLQAIPRGQYEAAQSLGLGYGRTMQKVILPQALKIVIPPMVNTFIGFFKDTTLVIIIGLFDFLTAIRSALTDPAWLGFHVEAYVFAAMVYFVFCFSMSRYSLWLERHLSPERRR